jgi:hypothetical protein
VIAPAGLSPFRLGVAQQQQLEHDFEPLSCERYVGVDDTDVNALRPVF